MIKLVHLRYVFITLVIMASAALAHAEVIVVTNTNSSGAGSLRQAILDANANPSATTINFNIPGSSDHTINVPEGGYPAITAPLTIDAGSQAGRVIIFNGAINLPGTDIAFQVESSASGSIIKNLTITNFVFGVNIVSAANVNVEYNTFQDNFGIDVRLDNANAPLIRGNIFSADPSRNVLAVSGSGNNIAILGNSITGETIVLNNVTNSLIGGAGPGAPNNISGGRGIVVLNASNTSIIRNTVLNTLANRPAQNGAIEVSGSNNFILNNHLVGNVDFDIHVTGGQHQINENIITGSTGVFSGISIDNASHLTVNGNRITGGSIELNSTIISTVNNNLVIDDPQGFSGHGAITLQSSDANTLSGNILDHNAGSGVVLNQSSSNVLTLNQSSNNGRSGYRVIDGVSNKISQSLTFDNHADAGGGKTGIVLINGNFNKPAPVITSAVRSGTLVTLSGTTSTSGDRIEIFLSDAASASTFVKNARVFLGAGNAVGVNWTVTVNTAAYSGTLFFTASATDVSNNTSELATPVSVAPSGARTASEGATFTAEAFPNPFTDRMSVTIGRTEGQSVSIRLFDLNGRLVYNVEEFTGNELVLGDNITPGIYSLQIISGEEQRSLIVSKR